MKYNLICLIIFINSFFLVYSLIQEWNLENSAIDLLASSDSFSVIVKEETKNNMRLKLYKYILKENGNITYGKHLSIIDNGNIIFYDNVDFDDIESFYHFDTDYIVCPKGKYHPTYFSDNQYSELQLNDFAENGDWELKCYFHGTGYFLVFYLNNGESQFFYKILSSTSWTKSLLHQEIYDFKLIDGTSYGEYNFTYLVKDENYIKLIGSKFTFNLDGIFRNDIGVRIILLSRSNHTRGSFENSYDHFYFFTYTNTSDFSCGYYDSTDIIDYLSVRQYSVNINTESPLEFSDDVEIQEIKFIKNYKYAYYKIYNPTKGKTYYGIIDIKQNLVVFNTDEEILTYVPFTDISMLAITSTHAYEICVIKKDGACTDSYTCTEFGYNYLLDLQGNKCGNTCDEGKLLLVKEKVCVDSCDETIYVLVDNQCGLCKYFYSDRPYKLINISQCFSSDEIPEGAEVYDEKLYLLKCKSGYILKNDICVSNCYETCIQCSDYSEDSNNQKCLACKTNYILVEGNCISITTSISTITTPNTIFTYNIIKTDSHNYKIIEEKNETDSINNIIKDSLKNTLEDSSNNIIEDSLNSTMDYPYSAYQLISDIINYTLIEFENDTKKNIIEDLFGDVNITEVDNGEDKVKFMDDLLIILTSTTNQKINESEKNITLDLGECEYKLKSEYDIPINDSLYILQYILEESGMKIPKMEYEIYYPLNQKELIKLNLTTCEGTKIDISIKVDINESIDKYNSSSDYYNDICSKAKSESQTDITLDDRRNEFAKNNMSLCEENCDLVEYNYDTKKAKCSCDIKLSIPLMDDIKFNKDDLYKGFIDIKNNLNLNIMKCFKEVFNTKSLLNNYGFFIIMFIILLYFICLFIFCFKSYNELITEINEIILSLKTVKTEVNVKPKKAKGKKRKSKRKKKSCSNDLELVDIKNLKENALNKQFKINNDEKSNIIMLTNKKDNNANNNTLDYKDFELNLLDYQEAKELDKRTYVKYYLALLKINHLFIFSFFSYRDYNALIIKIFLFFFFFTVYFTVNTLFFNDDTMHKIYVDEGNFNLIYQIPQIIYSSLISAVINLAIKFLALSQKNIVKIKQEKKIEDIDNKYHKLLATLKTKFISFFIVTFLLLLFFCYYITCFCGIYENTQIHLIKDTIISFTTSLIYPFIICLIPGIFRIISLRAEKGNHELLYKVSKLLQLI